MRVFRLTAAVALLVTVSSTVVAAQYPVDASWFANRWALSDWISSLRAFQAQGGSIVWQRGANFRLRVGGAEEIRNDPDFIWCWALENCLNDAVRDVSSRGLKIANWFTYSNDEQYDDGAMLRCAGVDKKINSSRVYHRIVVPHGRYSPDWNCEFNQGEKVDVVFTTFNGIDPHALLLEASAKLGMKVFLPQPAVPDVLSQRPAFYEFAKRVMNGYSSKFGRLESYAGVYQTNEAWLGIGDWKSVVEANKVLGGMAHAAGKQYVISPYIDINNSQTPGTTVEAHKTGFKELARSGCDVVAVQEGRGCGKGAYWWNFQANATVESVDPVLDKIVHYIDPKLAPRPTFSKAFSSSNQALFRAFEDAAEELKAEGVKTELWLNLEAFEYLRDYPCLPVDVAGNGMAELLDRTSKSRLDWGLTAAGSRPTKMISFAWDADYTCVPEASGYSVSLTEEIRADSDRPIVSFFDRKTGELRGFNIAADGTTFHLSCSSGGHYDALAIGADPSYGKTHSRSPLLQSATIDWANKCPADSWVCVTATSGKSGKTAFHELCAELGVRP